jgi:hypothetical protein
VKRKMCCSIRLFVIQLFVSNLRLFCFLFLFTFYDNLDVMLELEYKQYLDDRSAGTGFFSYNNLRFSKFCRFSDMIIGLDRNIRENEVQRIFFLEHNVQLEIGGIGGAMSGEAETVKIQFGCLFFEISFLSDDYKYTDKIKHMIIKSKRVDLITFNIRTLLISSFTFTFRFCDEIEHFHIYTFDSSYHRLSLLQQFSSYFLFSIKDFKNLRLISKSVNRVIRCVKKSAFFSVYLFSFGSSRCYITSYKIFLFVCSYLSDIFCFKSVVLYFCKSKSIISVVSSHNSIVYSFVLLGPFHYNFISSIFKFLFNPTQFFYPIIFYSSHGLIFKKSSVRQIKFNSTSNLTLLSSDMSTAVRTLLSMVSSVRSVYFGNYFIVELPFVIFSLFYTFNYFHLRFVVFSSSSDSSLSLNC